VDVTLRAGTSDTGMVVSSPGLLQWFIQATTGRLSFSGGSLYLRRTDQVPLRSHDLSGESWSAMVVAEATAVEFTRAAPRADPIADPLGFLAGRRYTCYCGRSVVGTMLCAPCADEMVRYFLRVARQPNRAP
jgi:hypothetical protein